MQEHMPFYEDQLAGAGYTIIPDVFAAHEIDAISEVINTADTTSSTFRKTADLFAIRQCLKEIPALQPLIFTNSLHEIIQQLLGDDYFVVKSIYFDKPPQSNWWVAWHQDLTISVDQKISLPGFSSWTIKQQQFAVQPPLEILEHIYTIRIHLDDTDATNGALKVIPGSHRKGIYRPETIDWKNEKEVMCNVPKGGVMLMRPLLLHASDRATSNANRRVMHIEFCNRTLPAGLQWNEYISRTR
ncbi:MAG TPA: phytanoyl-CoA dioxygenase family protein [Chitinophaga sp.]|uniref:phytanoyl-CoA dioxygenase family protein n=1 Tax=Chitinophaga sp. TaxID=1869181 RepID=UPI002F928B2C